MKLSPSERGTCQCTGCGEFFKSTYQFDNHRIWDYQGETRSRRCLNAAEMVLLGMKLDAKRGWGIPTYRVFPKRLKNATDGVSHG